MTDFTRPLADFHGASAAWRQPKSAQRFFELRAGEALLATLSFRSAFGTLAVGETAEGSWSYKRLGFLNPRLSVRDARQPEDQQIDLAVYQPRFWGDGVLTFQYGRAFAWKPTNFWATQWSFTDQAGKLVLKFMPGAEHEKLTDLFKTQATVELHAVEGCRDLLPVLLTLGMYLILLHHDDSAAAAATAGVA
jgi:hypothetical protein